MRVRDPASVVLEVGPVAVRRLDREPGSAPAPAARTAAMATAALNGIDDPVVLLNEQPIAVTDLWRTLLRSVAGSSADSVVVVHPSWWPRRRVDVVSQAATAVAPNVVALARRSLIDGPDQVVVEFGADVIAVSVGPAATVFGAGVAEAADFVVATSPPADVVIDAPLELVDAVRGAIQLRKRLAGSGFRSQNLDLVALARSVGPSPAAAGRRSRSHRRVLAAAALGVAAVAAAMHNLPKSVEPQADPVESLVEGRVALSIPAHWHVDRVTGGPGSRRLQVTSPGHAGVALHITQTYAPGKNLADAADMLQRAITDQPEGTFVDFDGAGQVAGRPAVTYREIRAAHVVRWAVVVDGATRISIGCQSPPTAQDDVALACDQAVQTAREVQ